MTLRAECKEALRRWRLKGFGELVDAEEAVEAGALLEAEFEHNLYRIRVGLENQ